MNDDDARVDLMFMQPADIKKLLADEAAYEADEAKRAFDIARQKQLDEERLLAADADAKAAAAAADFASREPPDDIADVAGLSPQRARLVRFAAWLAALETEHAQLVAGRTTYLETQRIPVLTQSKIDALIKQDRDGLLSLMAAGGVGITKHQARAHERKLLAERLSRDEYAASIAVSALTEADAKIDALAAQIDAVRSRHQSFIADCLQEHLIATAGSKLTAQMDALQAGALTVMGANGALSILRGVSHFSRPTSMSLPTPRLLGERWHSASEEGQPGYGLDSGAGYTVQFPEHLQDREKREWLAKADALLADPHADIEGH